MERMTPDQRRGLPSGGRAEERMVPKSRHTMGTDRQGRSEKHTVGDSISTR